MTGRQFEYKIRDFDAVPLTEDYTIIRKPLKVIYNRGGGLNVKCKTFEDLFNVVIDDGRKVIDIIETWEDIPVDSLGPTGQIQWQFKKHE